MDFNLYVGNGVWVLVPDCIVAPQAAISKYGPLRPLFEVREAQLGPETQRVMADIDQDMFAEIPGELALEIATRHLG